MRAPHAILAAAAILAAGWAHADINVGVSTALTGPAASLGVPVKNALSLWPTTIAGEKVNIVLLDDAADPTIATKNARRFIEDKVDFILGAANTPATIAIAQVVQDAKVVQLSPSPAEMEPGRDAYTYRDVMHGQFYTDGLVEHMKKSGVKTYAFIGYTDAYGESYLNAFNKSGPAAGMTMTTAERFTRADTSVTAQALKIVATNPDAVVIVAVGGGAALPQKALKERGYKGKIYQTPAAVSPDFLRLAGKDAEGTFVSSGPEQVPEQLPDSHPGKKAALDFVQQYEAKYGAGSRTQFAAHVYDFGLVLQKIVPVALKKGKPGTPEFRAALKEALDTSGGIVTTKGILNYTATDHWGHNPGARVILLVKDGTWKLDSL